MSLLRKLGSGLRFLFRKEQANRELNEELGEYLEMAADEKMKQGMSRQDALRAVRLERGSVEVNREIVRSGGWESLVETCWHDLRFGLRSLRKAPGFTVVAVVTLAFGIGANTAIFSLMDQVLLELLPVKHPEQLVLVAERGIRFGDSWGDNDISYPMYRVFAMAIRSSRECSAVIPRVSVWATEIARIE